MAIIDLGAAKIGIDVTDLREVMPAPKELQPFQSSGPGIVGCVALRGQVVPVVDLAPLIGLPSLDPDQDNGVIVIVGDQTKVYGIVALAALQIVQAKDCAPQFISRDENAMVDKLLSRLVLVDDEAIGLLDALALPALGVPQSRSERVQNVVRDATENFLLFETDGVRFCLPLSDIQATLPEAPVDATVLRAGPSEGGIVHHGIERPLLNLAQFFGMAKTGNNCGKASAVLLSRGEEKPLAFRADSVRDILSLTKAEIAAMPSLLSRRPEMFIGVHTMEEGHENFILDGRLLADDVDLTAYGALEHIKDEKPPEENRGQIGIDGNAKTTELALLVVAGARCALEVAVVEEIVSVPNQIAERCATGQLYLGNITSRRGALIPTFSLSAALGHPPEPSTMLPAIVVIDRGGELIGLAVDEIFAFERMLVMSDGADGGEKILQLQRYDDQSLWQVAKPEALPLHVV